MRARTDVVTRAVKIPMTPKGVEHCYHLTAGASLLVVKIPMTPKGVEHIAMNRKIAGSRRVKIPMTPKGVEHLANCLRFLESRCGEDSYDAERR